MMYVFKYHAYLVASSLFLIYATRNHVAKVRSYVNVQFLDHPYERKFVKDRQLLLVKNVLSPYHLSHKTI